MTVETRFSDGVLTVRKEFAKPIDVVFDAWIDAAKTTHWWGCADTTQVVSEIETKAGGKYCHTMTITNVGDHTINGSLVEFDPPRKLVYSMPASEFAPAMLVSVAFGETAIGTVVTLTQSEIPDPMKDVIGAGWTASFNRLDAYFQGQRRAA